MSTIITAGNATNNGASLLSAADGLLEIKTGTGAGTTAISIDASQNVTIAGLLTAATNGGSGIFPITASVATNALTATLNPTAIAFRSSTLTSGTVNSRSVSAAISVVVPSTTTLATVSGQQSRIAVLAIDNSGTVELAVTNLVGGNNLDETTLITTVPIAQTSTFTGAIAVTTGILTLSATGTGTFALGQALSGTGVPSGTFVKALLTGTLGAAGSTYSTNITTAVASTTMTGVAGSAIYSTTARTSVPFRVVGYIESTQATAGTWVTAPSTIQGAGGNALTAMSSLGYGQTWQILTVGSTRVYGTTYYNTTGKPIIAHVGASSGGAATYNYTMTVNGVALYYSAYAYVVGDTIIPPGASYVATSSSGNLANWAELR